MRLTLRMKDPVRLDRALREEFARLGWIVSRARFRRCFDAGGVRVGGRARPPSFLLAPGEHEAVISGLDPDEGWARPSPSGSFIPVIHEDEELLVLDKPSGVPSIPHAPEEDHTAVSAALARDPTLSRVGRAGLEPGILHRLDTGTSGCLAFARTEAAFERLSRAWKRGQVEKTYRAWVAPLPGSAPLEVPQTLRLQLGHDPGSSRRMVVTSGRGTTPIRGPALATITHLRKAHARSHGEAVDLEIGIDTGVMHQIRASLLSLGWPVMGDPVYRGLPSTRLWLHAWRLGLPARDGTMIELEAPLPPGWAGGAK